MARSRSVVAVLALAAILAPAAALSQGPQRRLVLGGGRGWPEGLGQKLVDWSGGEKARIMVVTWATASPESTFRDIRDGLPVPQGGKVVQAPSPEEMRTPEGRAKFLETLKHATGVYFSGGDQNRVMEVLGRDPELAQALRDRYEAGALFAGNSSGTAIMSDPMLTGNRTPDGRWETAPGLGLLPKGVIVDQHFIARGREARLSSVLADNPGSMGIGVEETTAVVVEDGRHATVLGDKGPATILQPGAEQPRQTLRQGERFDLQERSRTDPPSGGSSAER